MVGTTSRAERTAWGLALAALIMTGTHAPQARAADVPDAVAVSLEAADLAGLAAGIKNEFFAHPIEGRTDERYEQSYWLSTFGIEGLSYRVAVDRITLAPRNGRLHAAVTLRDLEVNVDRIFFNTSGSLYCSDMPLSSAGGTIPVSAELVPHAEGRALDVQASAVHVGLTAGNYEPGEPAACQVVPGLNWLLRKTLPLVAELLRPALEQTIEHRIEAEARTLASSLTDVLTAEITLPFAVAPAPAFNATIGLWPSAVAVTAERFQLKFGATVAFDPDRKRPARDGTRADSSAFLRLARRLPSYLGLSRRLIETTLNEANRQGLFAVRINNETIPAASNLMTARGIAPFLPDAEDRFDPLDLVTLRLRGAEEVGVVLNPCGPGGIPIIDVILDDLAVTVEVNGRPYYGLKLAMRLAFEAGLRASDHQLVLGITHLTTSFKSGAFDAGLDPVPADPSFNARSFGLFMRQVDEQLRGGPGRLLQVGLPDVHFGASTLEFVGSSVRDDYVTLDARVVQALGTAAD